VKQVLIRQFGGPEVVEVVEGPDPEPGPGEVVIRAHTMPVAWPDILIRNGVYRWAPPLPITLGQEMTGTIELVGPDVGDLEPGQPVYLSSTEMGFQSGCYDTMRLTPANAVVPLPAGIDLEQAAGLGYFALAWALLHETTRGFTPRSALIVGAAGGAGTALTQLARQARMLVIGTVSSDEKAEFARSNGADHLINYRTESVLDRVLEITKGRGVDLILDHVVGPHSPTTSRCSPTGGPSSPTTPAVDLLVMTSSRRSGHVWSTRRAGVRSRYTVMKTILKGDDASSPSRSNSSLWGSSRRTSQLGSRSTTFAKRTRCWKPAR